MKVEVCDRPEEVSERVGRLLDEGWCVVFPSEVVRRSFLVTFARRWGGSMRDGSTRGTVS